MTTQTQLAITAGRGDHVLDLRGLSVEVGRTTILDDVDLGARAGRIHAVLGSSGSGKTTLLRALLGVTPDAATSRVRRHLLSCEGHQPIDLSVGDTRRWRAVRQRHVAMVFQDPAAALTPLRRVGSLTREVLRAAGAAHGPRDVARLLEEAGLHQPDQVVTKRCCELSGGMAQRLGLALALAGGPALLLADEPTTALDVLARERLLAALRQRADRGVAVVLVTHDVALATRADDVTVLAEGRVVDSGPVTRVLREPGGGDADLPPVHPATAALLATGHTAPPERRRVPATAARPVLRAGGLTRSYAGDPVLAGVDLEVAPGEALGLVGQSGAGKSTLVRCLVGLERPDAGMIEVDGHPVTARTWARARRLVQLVPQHPRESLNPWRTAEELVRDPLEAHGTGTRAQRRERASHLLERVGLAHLAGRRPRELSTGQCQRVAVARALAVGPRLLIADEPVTALDAALRTDLLVLLGELTEESGASILVVSHDLAVLEVLCHRVAVLAEGRVVETLPSDDLHRPGAHPLTRAFQRAHQRALAPARSEP